MKSHFCSKGHENPSGSRFCVQCGEQLSNSVFQGISPGMMLGDRYRIVRELGHGGFGRTYIAEDLNRFNEPCVLKEFAPQVQGTYGLQKAAELFEREAGVLYKLQHPQIPKFRELFRFKQGDKGLLFLVQDYVVGQTYYALIDARRRQGLRFNEAEVMQLMLQLLPVLEYIHSLGVIHRDISPDNLILRSTDGLPVLIDFGGVKQVAATVASQFLGLQGAGGTPAIATRLGKVGYAPHEQMQAGVVSPHSDLYALAATVLVLLTLKEPQQLINPQTLTWDWRHEVNLSPTLGSVLDRMLQSRPGDRFQTAAQVLQALNAPLPSPPVAYPPTQPPPVPQTQATVAFAPAPAPWNQQGSPATVETPVPSSSANPSSGWLGKVSLVFVAIAIAGGVGWGAGNWWIHSQTQPDDSQLQPTTNSPVVSPDDAEPEPTTDLSPDEQRRKEVLQQRRTALGIRYEFYADLVNEEFWTQNPEERGRVLGTEPEDAQLRSQWDAIAANLLGQLERYELSPGVRLQLGGYTEADRDRWKAEANQLHIGSRTLYDLADAKFLRAFPDQRGKDFLKLPIGQVWQATVADTLDAVKSGAAFKRIVFDPGASGTQVSGNLKPGEGKAFIASLSEGQVMEANLTTGEKALFSLYSPTGKTKLLEDSGDRTWSGQLPESGFYEFVVVNDGTAPIDYQLDLTVENSAPSEPLPQGSPE
ncbi:protein kinase [Microcoleus sp. FACHB-SPT15]|uniref:serine/threonine-protein kinase n=1 Tax=Microcoleus sp. FACHB-SPT15 TaxID=2692830 RepID=UPI0017818DEA|nr:serine/threonine-protein kinase [Microcoleus sp. FACHB-SPT15]MBD1809694.1 protein kinase [Microcoleus sp. FACHB-SPT15]